MPILELANKKFLANLKTKIDLKFLYRSFLIKQNFTSNIFTGVSMPAKKNPITAASKRKGEKLPTSPLVKDPFSAAAEAKKAKLEQKKLENENGSEKDENNHLDVESLTKKEKTTKSKSRSPSPVVSEKDKKTKITSGAKTKTKSKKNEKEDQDENDTQSESKLETDSTTKYNSEDFKTPTNGKEYNLKIVSWNVNGIRAWIDVIVF